MAAMTSSGMNIYSRALFAFLALLLTGCASQSPADPSAKAQQPTSTAALTHGLPKLPAGRQTTGLLETSKNGVQTFARGGSSLDVDPVLQLTAGAGAMSWAMWELPAADELRYLDVQLSSPQLNSDAAEIYLALADYSSGRWQLEGPVVASRVLTLDPLMHSSPGGLMYAAVLVYGDASVFVQKLSLIAFHTNAAPNASLNASIQTGVAPLSVSFDAGLSSDPDPGDAVVRYLWDFDGDGAHEASSLVPQLTHVYTQSGSFQATVTVEDMDGSTDSAELPVDVAAPPMAAIRFSPPQTSSGHSVLLDASLSTSGSSPLATYKWDLDDDGTYELDGGSSAQINSPVFAEGGVRQIGLQVTDQAGNSAVAKASLYVSGWSEGLEVNASFKLAGELVDGRPAMAFYDVNDGHIKFIRALDSQGQNWGTAQLVSADSTVGSLGFKLVNGNPAILFLGLADGAAYYVRANDPDGLAWGVPQKVGSNFTGFADALEIIDGFPAVAYVDSVLHAAYFRRASDADGSQWNASVVVVPNNVPDEAPSLATINGVPAIAYLSSTGPSVRLVTATDPDGLAWGSPSTIALHNGVSLTLLQVGDFPALCFSDLDTNHVEFVRATTPDGTLWGAEVNVCPSSNVAGNSSMRIINSIPTLTCSLVDLSNHYRAVVLQALDSSGATWGPPELVDTRSHPGASGSLFQLADGSLALAYGVFDYGSLRFARRYP